MLAYCQVKSLSNLKNEVRRKYEPIIKMNMEEGFKKVKTTQDYAAIFSSKMFEYSTANDYFRKASW